MLNDEPSFLLEQLNCESISNHHKNHWHIERKERSEDEEHPIVDYALSRLGHDVPFVDDSCGVKRYTIFETIM